MRGPGLVYFIFSCYTLSGIEMNDTGPSWFQRLKYAWFAFRTLPTRSRFMIGKASFVEADVRATSNSLTEVIEPGDRPPEMRLLSHLQLETQKPRTGTQGWKLYEAWARRPNTRDLVSMECGFCGHLYILRIHPGHNPPLPGAGGAPAMGRPASYSGSWFNFPDEDFEGEPSLNCGHCETRCPPEVVFLGERPEDD